MPKHTQRAIQPSLVQPSSVRVRCNDAIVVFRVLVFAAVINFGINDVARACAGVLDEGRGTERPGFRASALRR
jgi:hypothetical protein